MHLCAHMLYLAAKIGAFVFFSALFSNRDAERTYRALIFRYGATGVQPHKEISKPLFLNVQAALSAGGLTYSFTYFSKYRAKLAPIILPEYTACSRVLPSDPTSIKTEFLVLYISYFLSAK